MAIIQIERNKLLKNIILLITIINKIIKNLNIGKMFSVFFLTPIMVAQFKIELLLFASSSSYSFFVNAAAVVVCFRGGV